MSVTFFPPGWHIDVPNPGYGEIFISALAEPFRGPAVTTDDWDQVLVGEEIGMFLTRVTQRAIGDATDAHDPGYGRELPGFLTTTVAAGLLPALQQAVILAVAGTERYERIYPDDGPPLEPLCVRCDQGTGFSPGPVAHPWCEQHGHEPFGWRAGHGSWDRAQAAYRQDTARWERRQDTVRHQR